ncbi:MAG: hypothetical protein M0021_10585 [Clostridia bacterium]|nr:hypothetical protein [Clostridia bacterium]
MSNVNYNSFGSHINVDANNLEQLELLDREDLIKLVKRMVNGGVSLMFHGKRIAQQIQRQVKPRTVTYGRRFKTYKVDESYASKAPANEGHVEARWCTGYLY